MIKRNDYQLTSIEKRLKANRRERKRVNELNDMFQVVLELLPPARFTVRLSRAQILREAIDYINRLLDYLRKDDNSNAESLFPHLFREQRYPNKKYSFRKTCSRQYSPTTRTVSVDNSSYSYSTTVIDHQDDFLHMNFEKKPEQLSKQLEHGHPSYIQL